LTRDPSQGEHPYGEDQIERLYDNPQQQKDTDVTPTVLVTQSERDPETGISRLKEFLRGLIGNTNRNEEEEIIADVEEKSGRERKEDEKQYEGAPFFDCVRDMKGASREDFIEAQRDPKSKCMAKGRTNGMIFEDNDGRWS
jgi:hypothetical protein